jgi:hypothetical protein
MAKCGMAYEKFSSSEESTHEQIQGENYDYCFFNSRGIVHEEFVLLGQTVNYAFYKDVWERLRKWVPQVQTDIATLQTTGCYTTLTCQLTLHFQFENFWQTKTFPYFHIFPTVQI